MIQSFKDRNTRRFFEGHRIAAFQGFANQATRRLASLNHAESLRDLSALSGNRLKTMGSADVASTAFESTRSGGSAFAGEAKGQVKWRSSIIIEEEKP